MNPEIADSNNIFNADVLGVPELLVKQPDEQQPEQSEQIEYKRIKVNGKTKLVPVTPVQEENLINARLKRIPNKQQDDRMAAIIAFKKQSAAKRYARPVPKAQPLSVLDLKIREIHNNPALSPQARCHAINQLTKAEKENKIDKK